jgi:hypothetical protein
VSLPLIRWAVLLAASGCQLIQGSGRVQTEDRSFSPFHAVHMRGIAEVTMVSGPGSISVTTDDNLLDYVLIEVLDGTLTLDEKNPKTGMLVPSRGIKVEVTTPDAPKDVHVSGTGSFTWPEGAPLTVGALGLHVDGAGSLEAAIAVTTLAVDLSGSGSITLTGTATTGTVDLSGTGDLRAFGLALSTAVARVSGTGSAMVAVSDSLDAEVSGTGSVLYRGSPAVTQRVSGTGSVRPSP